MQEIELPYEECLIELKRSAWRLQSRVRSCINRECEWEEDHTIIDHTVNQLEQVCENEFVEYVLNHIDEPKARLIIYKLYVEDLSEKQIATELNLTQQAVNRWKNKTLDELRNKKSFQKYVMQ